jgi:hypothetical protein
MEETGTALMEGEPSGLEDSLICDYVDVELSPDEVAVGTSARVGHSSGSPKRPRGDSSTLTSLSTLPHRAEQEAIQAAAATDLTPSGEGLCFHWVGSG